MEIETVLDSELLAVARAEYRKRREMGCSMHVAHTRAMQKVSCVAGRAHKEIGSGWDYATAVQNEVDPE